MHTIKMKVTPHERKLGTKLGTYYRVTPLPPSYKGTNHEKYSRSMCPNWFRKIFGVEPPTKSTYFLMHVEQVTD